MEINKKIRTGQPEADKYIEDLEDFIINFEASNIKKLIMECNDVAGIIADDIKTIREGINDDEIDNKLLMMGSKKNKLYGRFLEVVKSIKDFKTISDLLNDLKPKVSTKEIKSPTGEITQSEEPKKVKKNIQDFVFDKESA